jgi:tetratricopeptide (TPR) repeat protein
VRLLHGMAGYSCDWNAVWAPSGRRMIDLGKPLATAGRWVRAPAGPLEAPGPEGRVSAWHDEAMAHYQQGRHAAALRLFRRIGRLAGGPLFQMALAPSRFWAATLLHNMGRLGEARETLDTIDPALADDDTLYKALTRRVLVLIERGTPRTDIEAALDRVREEMAARNRHDWRARILLAEARLHEACGAFDAAARTAAEALARAQQEANAIAIATHLRTALGTALQARRWADAEAVIADWSEPARQRDDHVPAVLGCGRSVLARVRGDRNAAVQLARAHEPLLALRNERALRLLAGETLVRALLCAGDVAGARAVLGPLLSLRRAEVAHDRFAIRLLWADYLLARAQRGSGLPIIDPLTGRRFLEPAPPTASPASGERRLRAAEQAYVRAGDEGRRIDARLGCDWRERAIAKRLALVAAARRQLAIRRVRRGQW